MFGKKKGVAVMEATVFAKGGVSDSAETVQVKAQPKQAEQAKNHNLSMGSVTILQHTFFALAALEFFKNGREALFADDIRVKDSQTGREFSFSLTAKEIK